MTELELFYQLKNSVLEQYQKSYPFYTGNWKTFSSQDILNLIDDIQQKTKQTVSEKWIYTHLKPELNVKLPRKDMLDILCAYIDEVHWDAYKYKSMPHSTASKENTLVLKKRNTKKNVFVLFSVIVFIVVGLTWIVYTKKQRTIQLQNSYTKDSISKADVKAYVIEDSIERPIDLNEAVNEIKVPTRVIVKSPFYENKQVIIKPNNPLTAIELRPNDYALILKAFMKSDIKDWQTRKEQLQKILSDDLEVIVLLPNDLGAEYFNKTEFSKKLIVPTPSLKKMKIVSVQVDSSNKISFLRIAHEE